MSNSDTMIINFDDYNNNKNIILAEEHPFDDLDLSEIGNPSISEVDKLLDRYCNSINPLLCSSKQLFREIYTIVSISHTDDIYTISSRIAKEIDKFENRATKYQVGRDFISVAQYIICTFCDEMIGSSIKTIGESSWSQVSLLYKYYQEGYGGDKFFYLLDKFNQNPTKYIELMELSYLCLALGFGGRYKLKDSDQERLKAIKENLYKQIAIIRPKQENFYDNHPHAKKIHKIYSVWC